MRAAMTNLVRIVDAAYVGGWTLHRIAIALNRGHRGGQVWDELTVLLMVKEAHEERARPAWCWVQNRT